MIERVRPEGDHASQSRRRPRQEEAGWAMLRPLSRDIRSGAGRLSGLDMFIRRLMAQRACLERAADLTAQLPGPALQVGYGDGSAFDHLREILRRRELI